MSLKINSKVINSTLNENICTVCADYTAYYVFLSTGKIAQHGCFFGSA